MYNKIECITLSCDNCGETYRNEHSGFSIWTDESAANESADNDGWYLHGGKHYCPSCHEIDGDDSLILTT